MIAAALFSQIRATITRASHNIKIIWDKHYTGQNQAKGIEDLEERRLASKCPLCDNQTQNTTGSGNTQEETSLPNGKGAEQTYSRRYQQRGTNTTTTPKQSWT